MSFSLDAKAEVVQSPLPEKDCCAKAMLCGILRTCGNLSIKNGQYYMQVSTEIEDLFGVLEQLIKRLYNIQDALSLQKEQKQNHTIRYTISINEELSDKLLYDCFILKKNYAGDTEIVRGISRHIIADSCCERAFITGAFLGCASANIVIKDISDLKKHAGGYHLEFVFGQYELASDFVHLLADCGIGAKIMQRKKLHVVYIKEAEIVSDLLALVGANNAVMTLQNEFAVREVRNQLNRQLNCINSNLQKMVSASVKQIDAIQYLDATIGLESLSPSLYELCLLRLANPEENYENLAKLMTTPLTKSGVNHRLRKIVEMADEIRKNNQQQ